MTEARARRGLAADAGGRQAERAACAALERDGWAVLRRRARTPAGEIDIVVQRDGMVAFVEVKHRATLSDAALALSPRQTARLLRAADCLLAEHPEWQQGELRFDLMLVDAGGRVRRIADAIRHETLDT